MDPGFLLIDNFARMVAVVGILLAVPFFAYAGFLYMSAMGDPNKSAGARNAIISVCVGIVVIGCAFIIPAFVGDMVVAPAGGVVYERERGINCDGLLREQLVANRQVSTAERVNFIVKHIQSRFDGCDALFWTPEVREDEAQIRSCFDDPADRESISGVAVPRGLRRGGDAVDRTGRDARNNIIVHWSVSPRVGVSGLPSDGSICWMYVSATDTWIEGYQ